MGSEDAPEPRNDWQSRSRVEEIDNVRRFRYRTWNADGNPSYADWKWEVMPLDSMAQVSVSWDVYLKTLDRLLLAGLSMSASTCTGGVRSSTGWTNKTTRSTASG